MNAWRLCVVVVDDDTERRRMAVYSNAVHTKV